MSAHIKPRNFLDLGLGVVGGIATIMILDTQLSLAAMDFSDRSTLPNMDPHIRYFLIPMAALGLSGIAFILELLLFRVLRPRTATRVGWFLLGLSYSLIYIDLLLRHFVGRGSIPSIVAIVLVVACLSSVHYWLFEKAPAPEP